MLCKFCKEPMFIEGEQEYCCDNCGATFDNKNNTWTDPVVDICLLHKKYNLQQNIGKSKYVVNYFDGVKTHIDGSDFLRY